MVHRALSPCQRTLLRPASGVAALVLLWAGAASASLPESALARAGQLAVEMARPLAPAGARVLAVPGPADARLKLAPCADIQARPSPGATAWGRTRVLLRCASGPVAWQVSWPVTVQVWAPAWVAMSALPAGSTVAPGALAPGVIDWAAAATPPLGLDLDPAGRTLLRTLAAGAALREADLRSRQWFGAGDPVLVTVQGPGFSIKAEAQALTAGIEGRPATLKNMAGRSFIAMPMGAGRAEVRL